ncbi:hypothetical protein VTL71DRAFT_12342 [Oculimacula yallundae]|uniref:Uncharacterized protein n=1 Tax=Oculimacula yallundae TaxID=86028 RepID=A0ABR4CMB4_9HELO
MAPSADSSPVSNRNHQSSSRPESANDRPFFSESNSSDHGNGSPFFFEESSYSAEINNAMQPQSEQNIDSAMSNSSDVTPLALESDLIETYGASPVVSFGQSGSFQSVDGPLDEDEMADWNNQGFGDTQVVDHGHAESSSTLLGSHILPESPLDPELYNQMGNMMGSNESQPRDIGIGIGQHGMENTTAESYRDHEPAMARCAECGATALMNTNPALPTAAQATIQTRPSGKNNGKRRLMCNIVPDEPKSLTSGISIEWVIQNLKILRCMMNRVQEIEDHLNTAGNHAPTTQDLLDDLINNPVSSNDTLTDASSDSDSEDTGDDDQQSDSDQLSDTPSETSQPTSRLNPIAATLPPPDDSNFPDRYSVSSVPPSPTHTGPRSVTEPLSDAGSEMNA